LGEQAVDVFSGFIFRGGHFGLVIQLRPSHESLLLRVAELNGVIKSCGGFGALIRRTVQDSKLAAYYAIWPVKHKCRDRDWKTTVAGGGRVFFTIAAIALTT
jgi:hypothetical protein